MRKTRFPIDPNDAKHPEHTSRTAELQAKYDEAYPDESVAS
jgi:hypothetical protein